MRLIWIVAIFLLQSCSQCDIVTVVPENDAIVGASEVNRSIEQQTRLAGLVLVDQIENGHYKLALQETQKKYNALIADVTQEDSLMLELNHLRLTPRNIGDPIDQLVAQNPENAFAYLIRGIYLQGEAERARGDKWTHLTSKEQFEKMESIQEEAMKSLDYVLEKMPDNYLVHSELGSMYMTRTADIELSTAHHEKAIEIQPASYWAWSGYILRSTPRWGGSYSEMDSAIEKMKPHIKDNEALRVLQGKALFDKGDMAEYLGKLCKAKEHYQKALEFGEDHKVLMGLGYIDLLAQKLPTGCAQTRKAIKQRPYMRRYNHNLVYCEKRGF